MELKSEAHLIQSDDEAILVAQGLATEFAREAVDETDVDGFNLAYAVTHESFRDFVDLVVPELQRRGVYMNEYRPGTLREKLFGRNAHLHEDHPGACYRVRQEQGALT